MRRFGRSLKLNRLVMWIFAWLSIIETTRVKADVHIAVAANFKPTLEQLITHYQTKHKPSATLAPSSRDRSEIKLSVASSGQLLSQIIHGAPFDLFFAADEKRPKALITAHLAAPEDYRVYASGILVAYAKDSSRITGFASRSFAEAAVSKDLACIAMGNPVHAPYGIAAKEALANAGVWRALEGKARLRFAQNVAQVIQYIELGACPIGLLSLSLVRDQGPKSYFEIPHHLYSPIKQGAVLLKNGRQNQAAVGFWQFVASSEAQQIIKDSGYR